MTVSADWLASFAQSRWQVPSPGSVAWRDWGDEFVVYVGHRADTHLLSASAGTVLRCLIDAAEGLSFDALSNRVFGEVDAAALTAEESFSLLGLVQEFERLGLVARLTP